MVEALSYAQHVLEQPQSSYTYSFKRHWQMYEFHSDYVKITSYNEVIIQGEGAFIKPGGAPSLYTAEDAYNISISENLELISRSKKLDRWRGVCYENLVLKLKPAGELKKGEEFAFSFSYMVDRLPHLHTMELIQPGEEYHLGVNVAPCRIAENYCIVALPAGAEIHSTFHYQPSKKITTEHWIFLIYNVTKIKDNISLHVKFTLSDDESPPIKIEEVEEIL